MDEQEEGLDREEVPVVEVAEDQSGSRKVEELGERMVGQVCAGWLEEEPGLEVVCKEEV